MLLVLIRLALLRIVVTSVLLTHMCACLLSSPCSPVSPLSGGGGGKGSVLARGQKDDGDGALPRAITQAGFSMSAALLVGLCFGGCMISKGSSELTAEAKVLNKHALELGARCRCKSAEQGGS